MPGRDVTTMLHSKCDCRVMPSYEQPSNILSNAIKHSSTR